MFLKHAQIAPARVSGLLAAAEAAARAIPPAFPLSATVAVNPFLGQVNEDLATVAARMARVAGVRVTQERAALAAQVAAGEITEDDLAAALIASRCAVKPVDLATLKLRMRAEAAVPVALPTLAEVAAGLTGVDFPALVTRCFGLWAAGHFDRGQALWQPAPGRGAFAAWRDWASHDLTPEIAGLRGFCAHVAAAPDTAERAILRAAERLGITEAAAETCFHRLLVDLDGWAQHGRWLLWQAELAGQSDMTLTDLLAIRLVWEEAVLAAVPGAAGPWAGVVAAHEEPIRPSVDQAVDAVLQEAAERAAQRKMAARLAARAPVAGRAAVQAAFCIDVRSEVFRRALEAQDAGVETLGFAGFFGLPVSHCAPGSVLAEDHLPVLLRPSLRAASHGTAAVEEATRIAARGARAWGRFRQAAVSSFAFVESAGPIYGAKLVADALGLRARPTGAGPAPALVDGMGAAAKAATGAAVLRAMGLVSGHARVVLLLGHGARVVNNPHESAYHCGACGGQTGEVSARLLADLLNDPETRAGMAAEGVVIPGDTVFVAGLHETTTDEVRLFDGAVPASHSAEVARVAGWLARAGAVARAERGARLPGGRVSARAADWSEVRPEWGLAGCAAFIAAPRAVTAGGDLAGRAFLNSYDWRADAGFATLELILTAPVVVASWISLQYYGSSVAPEVFGGGNKLIHNVVGGIGVVEGNGGRLRSGLPWQAVHDGARLVHEPLRLSVMIEAPREAIAAVLARHEGVRALFDNGWLHLLVLEEGRVVARYCPGLEWEAEAGLE